MAAEIEDAASVRMSQHQRGVHTPRFNIAQNLAKALDVPVEYFYSPDDKTAELLLRWHSLSKGAARATAQEPVSTAIGLPA